MSKIDMCVDAIMKEIKKANIDQTKILKQLKKSNKLLEEKVKFQNYLEGK